MVKSLVSNGWTQQRIASSAGISQPVVHRALHGIDILYSNGLKIEEVYRQAAISAVLEDRPATPQCCQQG